MAFVARFLGRRLAYTYEIVEYLPGERLVMRTADEPFTMETTYTWRSHGPDRTRMTLRNRGEPAGFSRLAGPLVAVAMRRANRKRPRDPQGPTRIRWLAFGRVGGWREDA